MVSARASSSAGSARRPVVLIAGFEPFGGDRFNPSGHLAQAFHGRSLACHRVVGLALPTAFGRGADRLLQAIQRLRPHWVFVVGLAASRPALSIERVAINIVDARLPDNAGAQPVDRPVVPSGPVAYFSSLPIKAMLAGAREQSALPVEVSNSAGTFVCNEVFYRVMHALAVHPEHAACRAGFVHVPATQEMGGRATLAQVEHALRLALTAGIRHARRHALDRALGGGTTE